MLEETDGNRGLDSWEKIFSLPAALLSGFPAHTQSGFPKTENGGGNGRVLQPGGNLHFHKISKIDMHDQRGAHSGVSLLVITTGGTIDKVYFDASSEYEVGEPTVPHVFRESGVTLPWRLEPLFRKDSLEMNDADRAAIRCACEAAPENCILVTHGTDTMCETAEALTGIPEKTIVLTGALAPARFRVTDAVFNLGLALGAVQSMPPGVYLAMNGTVFPAGKVRKNRDLGKFEWL